MSWAGWPNQPIECLVLILRCSPETSNNPYPANSPLKGCHWLQQLQHFLWYYRKRGIRSASYIVREVLSVREREREIQREKEREREREREWRKWRHHWKAEKKKKKKKWQRIKLSLAVVVCRGTWVFGRRSSSVSMPQESQTQRCTRPGQDQWRWPDNHCPPLPAAIPEPMGNPQPSDLCSTTSTVKKSKRRAFPSRWPSLVGFSVSTKIKIVWSGKILMLSWSQGQNVICWQCAEILLTGYNSVYSIPLMHVTSWSESYPLRNSLMGVRGFRQVFVQSFHLSAFVLKRPALLALERQSQEMRFFSPPKTTSVGRLFEGETQALNEEVTLACRWGLRRWRKANLQIVKRYVKVCSSSQSSFFDATTIEEVMATWLLSEEVFESNRHFDDRQSWESVQEFTQVCTTEWIAFRRSVQEWIICGVQNQVKSWTALSTCRGSDYISTKDELQLLCWWTVQWTLVWTFPPLCFLHMYFTNVSTWSCN